MLLWTDQGAQEEVHQGRSNNIEAHPQTSVELVPRYPIWKMEPSSRHVARPQKFRAERANATAGPYKTNFLFLTSVWCARVHTSCTELYGYESKLEESLLAVAVKIVEDFDVARLARWTVSIGAAFTVVACAEARLDTFVIHTGLAFSTKPGTDRRRRQRAGLSVVRGSKPCRVP